MLVSIFGFSFLLNLAVAMPAAAVVVDGDELADPIPIASEDFGVPQEYDTAGATENPATDPAECVGEFGEFPGPFTETVWHSFTPDEDGDLIVDVNSFPDPEAEGFLAILFVFADDGEGGIEPVGCSAFPAVVQLSAEAGRTYYAMTGSLPETPGGGPALITIATPVLSDLTVDEDAAYDPQTDVITISGTVTCDNADFVDISIFARQEIGSHAVIGDGFTFLTPCDGMQTWSVDLTAYNSFFNPGRLHVSVDAFGCTAFCSPAHVEADVFAGPVSNRPGPPEPPPPPPPDNDEREGAFAIALDGTAEQDVTGATANETDPGQCPDEPVTIFSGHTVWYAFTAGADGWVEVNTIGSDYDTTLFVMLGDEIVACDDDIVLGFEVQSQLTFAAAAGTTYDLMIGAWQDSPPGNLVLNLVEGVEPPPPPPAPENDEREDAIALAVGDTLFGDTSSATANFATDPEACPQLGFLPFSDRTVWYTVTPDESGWLEVNTFGSEFDSTLRVILGDEVIACNDDVDSLQSQVVFEAEAGVTYEVMVGSLGPDGGPLVITAMPGEAPFNLSLTFDEVGTVIPGTGEVTLGVTVTCSEPGFVFVSAGASQSGGRFTAEGFGFAEGTCGPEPEHLTLTLFADLSKFQVGTLSVFGDAFAASEETGAEAFAFGEATMNLVPAGSAR